MFYKSVEVEIDIWDVEDYLDENKDKWDHFIEYMGRTVYDETHLPTPKTLVDEEKMELLSLAFKKYTLEELEERLGGNKFDLM